MIPSVDVLPTEITEIVRPTRTYKVNILENDENRVSGYVDGIESIQQAIYLILSSERYQHIIYSWDYGVELLDLIGKPMSYVTAELPRRIEEALIQDNRISGVTDFTFTKNKNTLLTTFTVVTEAGNISTELEVAV